jgi:hypothetical protein
MKNQKHEKDEPLSFVLFENDSDNPLAPSLVGKIVLADGTLMRLAAWEKTFIKDGQEKKLVGGKMSEYLNKEQYEKKFSKDRQPAPEAQEEESDLPF